MKMRELIPCKVEQVENRIEIKKDENGNVTYYSQETIIYLPKRTTDTKKTEPTEIIKCPAEEISFTVKKFATFDKNIKE